MHKPVSRKTVCLPQAGMTLVELMVSITIALIVLSGVVQVLVVSKSNFISIREMASLQENARFALKYLTDEIRLGGYSGCMYPASLNTTNDIKGSFGNWYLDRPGIQGYEYDAGIATFPIEFRAAVRTNTDAIAVRRGDQTGLRMVSDNIATSLITTNIAHPYNAGQVMIINSPDCEFTTIFQINSTTSTTNMYHSTGTVTPGNAVAGLYGTTAAPLYAYFTSSGALAGGTAPTTVALPSDSTLMAMHSEAYYIGNSDSDSTVPALFRQRMMVDTSTSTVTTVAEELVQGVENMQILYGVDTDGDGLADKYLKASGVTGVGSLIWRNVVSVRLIMRLRSIAPVYVDTTAYNAIEDGTGLGNTVAGTSGSDRFMRQTIVTTIMLRNYHQ